MNETLEAMARALFKSWFVDFDPVRAKAADLIREGVLEIGDGYRAKNSELGEPGLPFIRAGNLNNGIDTMGAEVFSHDTIHGAGDKQPLASGYVWATQIMAGLKLADVVKATRAAFEWSDPANPGMIEVTPGRTAYAVPFFYPEMIELVSELLRHRFDVWVVSASNAWSVRWMVLNVFNPLLCRRGASSGLRPDHVIGISTLLADANSRLYKDAVLVLENEAYARLDNSVMTRFRLTSHLHYPVPTYSGKIAAIFDRLPNTPYFVAGDSPGDLPMMTIGRHRLWIARLNKSGYQKTAAEWRRRTGGSWLVQTTRASREQGFLP